MIQISSARDYKAGPTGNDRFSFKTQTYMGFYAMPSGNINSIDPSLPTGINFGVEFPSTQQRPWQQYLNNPTVGMGVSYINLGADEMGHAISMYPYIMLNCLRTDYFHMKVKLGAGLAAVNERHLTTQNSPTPNRTFSTLLNAYLNGGLNLEFPVSRNFAINGEFGFHHMSNGRTSEPNGGSNILYGAIGLVATINPEEEEREPIHFPDLPYRWSLNISASSGAQEADESDGRKFMIGTFHAGAVYSPTNWYGFGLGVDIFFNDAIGNETNRGLFRKDLEYTTTDKMRVGLGLNNEFKFGMVTALVDWGVYLYNPSRNYYANEHPIYGFGPRPLFYKAERAGIDDGWHYIRFGVRTRVWDNIYIQALAKTHLHICEFLEIGIGYQIPFIKKSKRNDSKDIIFHHRNGWWKNYQ